MTKQTIVESSNYVVYEEDSVYCVVDKHTNVQLLTYDTDICDSVRDVIQGKRTRAICKQGESHYLIDHNFNVLREFGTHKTKEGGEVLDIPVTSTFCKNLHIDIKGQKIVPLYVLRGKQLLVYDLDGRVLKTYKLGCADYLGVTERYLNLYYKNSYTYFDMYRCEFVDGTGMFETIRKYGNFIVCMNEGANEVHVYNRDYSPSRHFVIPLTSLREPCFYLNTELFAVVQLLGRKATVSLIHRTGDRVVTFNTTIGKLSRLTDDIIITLHKKQLISESINI